MYNIRTFIEDYKILLTIEIMNFLRVNHPLIIRTIEAERAAADAERAVDGSKPSPENVTYVIKCSKGHGSFHFLIDTSEHYSLFKWDNNDDYRFNHTCIDMSEASIKEHQAISDLLLTILNTDCGYELWKNIDSQQQKMPGWWAFFSRQRSLSLAIAELQKLYPLDKMIEYILKDLKDRVINLNWRVDGLKAKIGVLKDEKAELQEKCLDRQDPDGCIRRINGLVENLQAEKAQALEVIEQLKTSVSIFRGENERLSSENQRLHGQLIRLISKTSHTISALDPSGRSDPNAKGNINKQYEKIRRSTNPSTSPTTIPKFPRSFSWFSPKNTENPGSRAVSMDSFSSMG